jgi:cytochrome P450
VRVIADLVGVRVPADRLLRWGRRTFDGLGPINRRAVGSGPTSLGMLLYAQRLRRSRVVAGSWAASVFDARDRGEISGFEARTMIIDLIAPSLDTTILAAGSMLWTLGRDPELYAGIRADPDTIPAAVVEAVRLASPIRGFTRRVARDTELGDVRLRSGERVVMLFAAANRDERAFPEPGRFDLERKPAAHLGWGNGPHTCVGIHLAKLELQALLRALTARVASISVGDPVPLLNNTLQGPERFSARLA